jgi:hypothetical protein
VHSKHVAELYGSQRGRAAIVIGGGPSAREDWEKIPDRDSAYIISCNDHGHYLAPRVDLVVCKDHRKVTKLRPKNGLRGEGGPLMEPIVRRPGVPVATEHHWADYRMALWPIQGNTGQRAVGVAALTWASPVWIIGIDWFAGERMYFHNDDFDNVSKGISTGQWHNRWKNDTAKKLEGADLRALRPPMSRYFAGCQDPIVPQIFHKYRDMPVFTIRAKSTFSFGAGATKVPVPEGTLIPCDTTEARRLIRLGVGEAVGAEPTEKVDRWR